MSSRQLMTTTLVPGSGGSWQSGDRFVHWSIYLFWRDLLCFILFRSVLFCFILFRSVSFCFIPFHSPFPIPFRSVCACNDIENLFLFKILISSSRSAPLHSERNGPCVFALICSISIHFILFRSVSFCFILFRSVSFCFIPFHL